MNDSKAMIFIDPYEDVTLDDVRHAIDMGFVTITEIKNFTRAGMGIDQGRVATNLVAEELASFYKVPVGEVMHPSYRPPLVPVLIGTLADAHAERLKEGECK